MLCFRLLYESEPASVLLDAVQAVEQGQDNSWLHAISPTSFSEIPTAPFAYWSITEVRKLFASLPAFEGNGRTVKQGLATADDFRFVRYSWEAPITPADSAMRVWYPFAKGGSRSPYYADIKLNLNWRNGGRELDVMTRSVLRNTQYYFLPGMTWPLRGSTFSSQAVPTGGIFSVAGKMATSDDPNELYALMCMFNSKPFDYMIRFFAGKVGGVQYEVGLIGTIPIYDPAKKKVETKRRFLQAWSTKRRTDTATLTSHAFHAPALAPGRKTATR